MRSKGVFGFGLESLNDSSRPLGLERSFRVTVFGSSRIVRVSVSPPLSVAVSCSSIYDGYSWSGPGKLSLSVPS